MLVHRDIEDGNKKYVDVVNTFGNQDYIKDGQVFKNAPVPVVLVEDESDITGLLGAYITGTIAYTAGFKAMWQKASDGTWVTIIEEAEGGE